MSPIESGLTAAVESVLNSRSVSFSLLDEGESRYVVRCTGDGTNFDIPCRGEPPQIADSRILMICALLYFQLYEACDDYLEWAKELGLQPGDRAVLDEFDDLNNAYRDFRILLGEDTYQALRAQLTIDQAIGRAWAGFQRGNPK